MSLRDQARNHLESRGSGEHRIARLELADFELHLIFFGFADVGRIGDDEIEGVVFEAREQVSLMELDAGFELMAGGVGAGDFQRGGGNVSGVDFGLRQFLGQRQRDAAGAGA